MNYSAKIRYLLLFLLLWIVPKASYAFVSITVTPPELPVYAQPPCPVEGYIWTPGYWAYGDEGYYWVPGVWVAPPRVGFLWTPGYWGFDGGVYAWHGGYWGPHVGFYGGINYGFGYGGVGFWGGEWAGNVYRYNTAVTNVNTTVIHNTYVNNTVINNNANTRASFNGTGGVTARPTTVEQTALHEAHLQPTATQLSHEQSVRGDRNQLASVNHGHPTTTALSTVKGSHEPAPSGNQLEMKKANQGVTPPVEKNKATLGSTEHPDRHVNENDIKSKEHQPANHNKSPEHQLANHNKSPEHQAVSHPKTETGPKTSPHGERASKPHPQKKNEGKPEEHKQ
jgi:WXXGXW repeat (2 copies)